MTPMLNFPYISIFVFIPIRRTSSNLGHGSGRGHTRRRVTGLALEEEPQEPTGPTVRTDSPCVT